MKEQTEKNIVTLVKPIQRGDKAISKITITEVLRQAGCLRGLKVYDVLTADFDTLVKLLPRVTQPALTTDEIMRLDIWDICQFSNAVADFLQPASARNEPGTDKPSGDAPLIA
ncbi:phage tail assembly protein [Hafnia alvei]|uniref:phage tail assembly protein n=1 Tax=Hafnia alvei TaxID=569 RepID=UPI000B626631|nr:phage tail assembly protein [Hafnia alvei]MBI0276665.1 phage tail assembly protein [Hafnia alvei]MBI0277264.1 phage tail assembly protein [Hafnia alvei]PNK97553.1 phage tail protein [Hafnia alvei]PNL03587.1 phage tail protein [Hafnia alvei]